MKFAAGEPGASSCPRGYRIGAAMLALALVAKVPFVGGFVVLAAMLLGMGAIVMAVLRPATPAATA